MKNLDRAKILKQNGINFLYAFSVSIFNTDIDYFDMDQNMICHNLNHENYKLALYKKWLSGYSWNRTYDSEWNELRKEYYNEGEEEPPFTSMLLYLEMNNINYNTLKLSEQNAIINLIKTQIYYKDRYYGSDEELVHYILLDDIDEWIKKYNDH